MKNKLSVLLALLFLLCTAMCCEEFEEYIPCQVTLTGIGKVEHLDNAGSVPVAPVGGVVSRQAYMLRIPLDFEYEKEIVEGTYYEYILTDTIANIQIIPNATVNPIPVYSAGRQCRKPSINRFHHQSHTHLLRNGHFHKVFSTYSHFLL